MILEAKYMDLMYGKKPKIKDVNIREVSCKTALSDSGLESDYALNPYTGCSHGCKYCYAPFVTKEKREWGSFVDVKRNIPKILADELDRKEKGIVRIGSVTDPYQEIEKDYQLTRMCLEQLKKKEFPIIVQTKSDLVTRDIDIYEDMDVDIGLTITSIGDDFREIFEPNAPTIEKRFEALRKLVEAGLNTWVFIGPLVPYKNDDADRLMQLAEKLQKMGVSEIYIDKLNMREGIWPNLQEILDEQLLKEFEKIFKGNEDYFQDRKNIYKQIGRPVF
ncbi:MAG: radical SAM protein [Candidatus Saliniplasma sp.]